MNVTEVLLRKKPEIYDFIYKMSRNRQKKSMLLITETVTFRVRLMTRRTPKRGHVLFLDPGAGCIGVFSL